MPVRTYNDNKYPNGLPHVLKINGHDPDEEPDEIEKFNKTLAFVDINTALHHRIVTRDPICGVGDLPEELNPLKGHKLRGRPDSHDGVRDPILLLGDLGTEYNCLYTTKDLVCKDRENRNIITLDGELGVELDPIRPHGGRPRNFIQQAELRNPITGQGEFRKEWDPIWKYEGRHYIKRPEQKKRDPVTHNVPAENMGEGPEKHYLRRFNNDKSTDIVSHEHPTETTEESDLASKVVFQTGIRHYPTKEYRDPITHENKLGNPEDKTWRPGTKHFPERIDRDPITHENKLGNPEDKMWRPGTKHFPERIAGDDPITHHGLEDDSFEIEKKQQEAREKAKERVIRDPISGEGIFQKECKALWNCSSDYPFRSFLNPKHIVPKSKTEPTKNSKPIKKNNK